MLAFAVVASLAAAGSAAPASATSSSVRLALSVSPATAVDGTRVTYTGTITRVTGSPRNVRVYMGGYWFQVSVGGVVFRPAGGTCSPAANCTVDDQTGNPEWVIPSVATSVKVKFTTLANSGRPVWMYLEGGAGCARGGGCSPSVVIAPPKVAVAVTYTADSWPVMPGTTLHVAVRGTTTAGPLDADVQAVLGAGLDTPTSVAPDTAVYAPPPASYIDDATGLNPTTTLRFDTKVTAAIGSNVRLTGNVWPSDGKYASARQTISIHVGPAVRYENTSSRLRWTGIWHTAASRTAWGGTVRYATRKGASVSFTFTGWGVAWVAPKGPTRGSAAVYVDGRWVRGVSLYAPSGRSRVVVYSTYWPTAKSHTIRIVNAATGGRPRIDIDAFLVAR